MKLRVLATALVLVTSLASCRDATSVEDDVVSVVVEGQAVRLQSQSNHPLAYAAFDAEILALINWAKCADPGPQCLRLPARGSVLIPFNEIFTGGRVGKVAVFAWRVVPKAAGGFQTIDVAVIPK
jgi:hypothetical protein